MKKYFCIVVLVFWMLLIFNLSGQDGIASLNQSNFIVKLAQNFSFFENFDHGKMSVVIRKSAHFFVYFVLALILYHLVGKGKSYAGIYYTLSVVFLYACSDELHQSFVVGRGGKFSDVLIDSAGGIAGVFMYVIMEYVTDKYFIKAGLQAESE